jgi:hypothetical protein
LNVNSAKEYPTFVSSFEKFLSHSYFDDVIVVADEFMQGIVHQTNLEFKNLRIIEYSDDVIEQF